MKRSFVSLLIFCLISFICSSVVFSQGSVYVHDFTKEVCKEQFWPHGGDRAEHDDFVSNLFNRLNNGEDCRDILITDSYQYDQIVRYLEDLKAKGTLESVKNSCLKFYTVEGFDVDNDKRMIVKIDYLIHSNNGEIIQYNDFIGISQEDLTWKLWGVIWKDTGFNVTNVSLDQLEMPKKGEEICILHTTAGDIKIRLFGNHVPKTVENFVGLAKKGYYDGTTFHRTINEFVIQGGDPTGTCEGGESLWGENFEDEFSTELYHFRGAVSMANSGPNTNGSQYFIVQRHEADANNYDVVMLPLNVEDKYKEVGGTPHLDRRHAVFGQVFEGMEVVDAIAAYPLDEEGWPIEPAAILSVEFVIY